uniref:Putative kinesin-like protein n=1 Tax=Culex tarsalis TaxID=7177 RepID=A0A1Q3F2B3_CULTA
MADNVTVSIKVRPLIRREKEGKLTPQWRIRENTIHNMDGTGEPFVFDNIFDETVSTRELFDRVCRPVLLASLNGINGTIFAYGQTSSGKTYTMMGDEHEPGVVPLAAREIFREIEQNKDRQFLIRVGYIEIYNEKIFDLLDRSNNANLKVFENSCGDVSVNYKEMITNCPEQVMQHLEEGNKVKRIGDTNMNERSSRSHTIFRITIESREIGRTQDNENDAVQISTLNLVDLAGSERADQTGATGSRLKEGAHINKSLLSLSCVIQKLSENAENQKFINYRDSKLTRILQASLGGNAVTSMICNITPAAFEESYSTLCFANRAKNIKNKPKVNEVLSEAAMMKRLEKEIKRLQEELRSEQSKNSKIKTLELQNAITMRANQIINSQTHLQFDKSRRRTWCPSTVSGIPKPIVYEQDSRLMPPPPPFARPIDCKTPSTNSEVDDLSPVIRPELLGQNFTKDLLARKVRSTTPSRQFLSAMSVDSASINPTFEFNNSDEFVPGELADFGDRSPQSIAREIHTPCALRPAGKRRSRRSTTGDSPANFIDYEKRCKELEQELRELQEFTNLEKNLDLADLKQQLSSREDLQNYQDQIDSLEDRCKDLEVELHQKREQVFDVERELIVARKERESAVKEAERCRNLQESIQVEFEVFQGRAKTREKELIESLQEARGDRSGSSGSTGGRSSAGSGVESQQKQLDDTRKELKQLEVHNYKLQQQLEQCTRELEEAREGGRDRAEKLDKFRTVLEKDIGRKDSKRLFRAITSLRAILADEDLLLINTSDPDLLVDSLGDSSLNDSEERVTSSPQKVLLTNESGKTSVIYENNNSQIMDISIENGELKKKVKLLEDDFAALHLKYAEERERIKELEKQRDQEHGKVSGLSKSLQEREAELKKLTCEYDELSTQVMDDIQEMERYKDSTAALEKKLEEKNGEFARLEQELKNSTEVIQVLRSSEKEWTERLASLEEECSIAKQLEEELNREVEEARLKCRQADEAEAKVAALQETVGQLEKEIEDYTITVQKHSLDIDSLQESVAEKEQLLRRESERFEEFEREKEAQLSQLKISLETLREEKATLLEEQDLLQKQLESAREPDADQLEEIALLKQHIVSLQEERDRLTTEKEQDTNHYRIDTNGDGTENLEKESHPEKPLDPSQIEDLRRKCTELEALISTKEEELKAAKEHSNQLTKIEQELLATKEQKQQSDERADQLSVEMTDLKNEINTLLQARQSLEHEVSNLKGKIADVEASLADNESEKRKLVGKIQTLENEIEESSRFRDQLDQEVQGLRSSLSSLDQELKENGEKLERFEKQNDEYKRELSEKTETVDRLRQQLDENELAAERRVQQTQAELEEALEERVRKSTEELTTMVTQLELAAQRASSLENQIADLKLEMEQTELNRSAAERLREDVEQELTGAKEALDEAKVDRREKEIEIEDLKRECARLLQELADTKAELSERSASLADGERVRVDLEEQLRSVRKELEAAGEVEVVKQTLAEELQKLREDYEVQLKAEKERYNELQQVKDQLEGEIQELTQKYEATLKTEQETVTELEQAKLEVEVSIREREAKIHELKHSHEHALTTVQERVEKLSSAVEELEQVKLNLEGQIKDLTHQLETTLKTEQDRSEKLTSAVEELEQVKQQLKESINEREASVKAEKDRCNELQERIDQLEQTNLSLEVQANALRENHESSLSSEKRNLEEQLRSVQENHNSLQESHAALRETNQQLDREKVQLSAELINARSALVIVEKKLESVQQQLSDKYLELDDLKRKHGTKAAEVDTVKAEKDRITTEMDQKLKEFEVCRKELTHLSQNQVPSMQSTIQQLTVQREELERKLLTSAEELSRRTSELHNLEELYAREKTSNERLAQQLEEAKLSPALQPDGRPSLGDGKVAQALRKENEDLLKQLNELQKMHVFKTKQLQDRIDELRHIEVEYGKLKDEMATMRHNSSFQEKETEIVELTQKINHYEQVYEETNTKHRSLQRQNDELRVRHQNLVMEMDDLRRIADKDRKSRRQSTHDDRRGVHFNTRDSASMTDPSSTDCSCLEMDAQIKNLKKQLTIKDCQINTQKKLASANPLKNDIVELRNLLKDRERDILTLQEEVRTLSLATADKRCNSCLRQQRMRALRSDKAVGTDHEDCAKEAADQLAEHEGLVKKLEEAQEELRKLNEKYQQMKRLCRIRNEKIQDLVGKENESSAANQGVQQEVSLLRRQLKETEERYSTMQRMYQSKCNGGVAKVERTVQTETRNDDMEMLRTKYEKYKSMSIALSEQVMELKRRVPSK